MRERRLCFSISSGSPLMARLQIDWMTLLRGNCTISASRTLRLRERPRRVDEGIRLASRTGGWH